MNLLMKFWRKEKESESAIFKKTWQDKSIVIYSKEVVSLVILGSTFNFYLYPLF